MSEERSLSQLLNSVSSFASGMLASEQIAASWTIADADPCFDRR